MGETIRIKGKDGQTKYIADSKGTIHQVGKDGSMKALNITESSKVDTVKITKKDLKDAK